MRALRSRGQPQDCAASERRQPIRGRSSPTPPSRLSLIPLSSLSHPPPLLEFSVSLLHPDSPFLSHSNVFFVVFFFPSVSPWFIVPLSFLLFTLLYLGCGNTRRRAAKASHFEMESTKNNKNHLQHHKWKTFPFPQVHDRCLCVSI